MDILNFISWIKGKRQVTSVNPSQSVLPVGLKDPRRDDQYIAGAISVQDFTAQVSETVRPYKVFTALLTQSGGDNIIGVAGDGEYINLGVTYQITENPNNYDLTIYGAPNNIAGTFFIANQTVPLPYTNSLQLLGNTGAPVATVLENTIGNIWFRYDGADQYTINSSSLFPENKTIPSFLSIYPTVMWANENVLVNFERLNNAVVNLVGKDSFSPGPIEIRVYN